MSSKNKNADIKSKLGKIEVDFFSDKKCRISKFIAMKTYKFL